MNYKKEIKKIFLFICQTLIFVFIIINFIGRISIIQGKSMEPKLYTGERILVNLLQYHLKPPKRFDIIIFQSPINVKNDYIKRVIGLENEKIEMKIPRPEARGIFSERKIYSTCRLSSLS